MTRIEVAIDELVLRGEFSPAQARAIAAQLESRLAVLAEGSTPARGRAESFRRLEPVTAKENGLGDAVAHAVWGAIA